VHGRRCEGCRSPCLRLGSRLPPADPDGPERSGQGFGEGQPRIETHPAFPNRINVQFARVLGRDRVDIRIWERGAGYTLASGSSSCGAASAAVRNGLCDHGRVKVRMPGGELTIHVRADWSLRLEGPVEEVYRGTLSAEFAASL
jgi:diaminopimelate epimerase